MEETDILQDIDSRLEAFFSSLGAPAQGLLESMPWVEQPMMRNRVVFTATLYPSHLWWHYWRTQKAAWQRLGFSVSKPGADWIVSLAIAAGATVCHVDPAEVPAPDGLDYYDFQKTGIRFLAERSAVLLADEPGLGKSVQVCGLLNLCSDIRSALIVTPASMKLVWRRELARWLVDSTLTVAVAGLSQDPIAADVVLINYDLLAKFNAKLVARSWDLIVLDEAQFIKNQKAQRTKLVLGLRAFAKRKVLLTGTPIMNRPNEIWSLLNFLDPGAWGKFFPFAIRYCNAHKTAFGWDFKGHSNLQELSDRLQKSGAFLRRTRREVLPQLPTVTRQVIPLAVPLSELVEELTERIAERLGLDLNNMPFEIDPEDVPFELTSVIRHELGLIKTEAALRFIEDETGDSPEKVVIFAHHKDVLDRTLQSLKDSVLVTGSDSTKVRDKAVEAFQSEAGPKYFIASTQAMGVGVTLTAASRVIFLEPDWTPAMLDQAEGRLCRIGQKNTILSQYLVVNNSIDEKILAAVRAKQRVIDVVLKEG